MFNSGIYCIINTFNNKRYIGQAVDIQKRWHQHRTNKGSNILLQHAFKKYGIENFEFIVLEYVPKDKELLTQAEQKWLDFFIEQGKWDRLYNLNPTAESSLGRKVSDKTKDKLKDAFGVPIFKYDLDGNFIEEFRCSSDAVESLNVLNTKFATVRKRILECIQTIRLSSYGFIWLGERNDDLAVQTANKKKQNKRKYLKNIVMCDLQTLEEIKTFNSIIEATFFLTGVRSSTHIGLVLRGLRKSAFGYFWKCEEND